MITPVIIGIIIIIGTSNLYQLFSHLPTQFSTVGLSLSLSLSLSLLQLVDYNSDQCFLYWLWCWLLVAGGMGQRCGSALRWEMCVYIYIHRTDGCAVAAGQRRSTQPAAPPTDSRPAVCDTDAHLRSTITVRHRAAPPSSSR